MVNWTVFKAINHRLVSPHSFYFWCLIFDCVVVLRLFLICNLIKWI